jgi:hypothetical protein
MTVAHDGLASLAVADLPVFLDEVGDLALQRIDEHADGPFSEDLFELRAANFGCGLLDAE